MVLSSFALVLLATVVVAENITTIELRKPRNSTGEDVEEAVKITYYYDEPGRPIQVEQLDPHNGMGRISYAEASGSVGQCLLAVDTAHFYDDKENDDSFFFFSSSSYCHNYCQKVNYNNENGEKLLYMYLEQPWIDQYTATCQQHYGMEVRLFSGVVDCGRWGIVAMANLVYCFPSSGYPKECDPIFGVDSSASAFVLDSVHSVIGGGCTILSDKPTTYYHAAPLPGTPSFPTDNELHAAWQKWYNPSSVQHSTNCWLQEPYIDKVWITHSYGPDHWESVTAGVVEQAGKNHSSALRLETLRLSPTENEQSFDYPGPGDPLFETYCSLCGANDGYTFRTFNGVLDCKGFLDEKPIEDGNFGVRYSYELKNLARCMAPLAPGCQEGDEALLQWFANEVLYGVRCRVRYGTNATLATPLHDVKENIASQDVINPNNNDNSKDADSSLALWVALLAALGIFCLVLLVGRQKSCQPLKLCTSMYQPLTMAEIGDETPIEVSVNGQRQH